MARKLTLETQVRNALVEEQAQELLQQFQSPESIERIKNLTQRAINELVNSIISAAESSEPLEEEEKEEMRKELTESIAPKAYESCCSPKELRKLAYLSARSCYRSTKQIRRLLKKHFASLKADGEIEQGILEDVEEGYEDLFKYGKIKDKMVKELAEIAREEGIEVATQKQTRYAIIRKMFPKPEQYREVLQGAMRGIQDCFKNGQERMMCDGAAGRIIAGMYGEGERLIREATETTGTSEENYLEKTIREIYG